LVAVFSDALRSADELQRCQALVGGDHTTTTDDGIIEQQPTTFTRDDGGAFRWGQWNVA